MGVIDKQAASGFVFAMRIEGCTKTTGDCNADVRYGAESRGSLKSVQITQGAVGQYAATAELTIRFFTPLQHHKRSPDL